MKPNRIELRVPDLGDSDSIELLSWNIAPGETFQAGDELCEMVTDKAAFSLEAPEPGTLDEILIQKGAVEKNQIVGYALAG